MLLDRSICLIKATQDRAVRESGDSAVKRSVLVSDAATVL
jgi:hypothetical protein